VERGAEEDVAGNRLPFLLAEVEPVIFCARATRGLGRPSFDTRSGGHLAARNDGQTCHLRIILPKAHHLSAW
jgi:hypothetical protein